MCARNIKRPCRKRCGKKRTGLDGARIFRTATYTDGKDFVVSFNTAGRGPWGW